jgi:hypothetical protein
MQQHNRDGEHLRQRVGLAENAGFELPPSCRGVEDRRHQQDADISSEDQNRHTDGHQPFVQEHEEQGAEQEFVGDGVKILSQDGTLFEPPGQQAVERVGEPCDHEENEADFESVFEDGGDQEWRHANPQEREQVGRGAQRIEPWFYGDCHLACQVE